MRHNRLTHLAWCGAMVGAAALTLVVPGCPGCPPGKPTSPGGIEQRPVVTPEGVPVVRVLVSSGSTLRVSTTGGYRILVDGREVGGSASPLASAELSLREGSWTWPGGSAAGRRLKLEGVGQCLVGLGSTFYRGYLVFHTGNGEIKAVNYVEVESYLAGVLARELFQDWDRRAYEAQAVAARTYALYDRATIGRGREYDVTDNQSSQVYGGIGAETELSRLAVRNTRGLVLGCGPRGEERIFRTHFSSTCGGMTNSVYVLYGPPVTKGPLAGGVVCTDCSRSTRYRWPTVTVSKRVIHQAVARGYPESAGFGGVKAVVVTEELAGRAVWVDVVGADNRKLRIRADDLRLCLLREGVRNLNSMNCRIVDRGSSIAFTEGKGFGHGVGLCQWGTQGKALRGESVEDILFNYYPGAKLFRAY